MPIVEITLVQGRSNEEIEKCIRQVAKTVHECLNAPLESIRVFVTELPPNRFAVGDKLKSDK